MHPFIYKTFNELLSGRSITGPVLEVGAIPHERSLLNLPILSKIEDKIGLNMDGPYDFKNFKILKGNANHMDIFPDEKFALVLCNAMLEHDKYFWKTIAEIYRVTKPGGTVIIGTPGYAKSSYQNFKSRFQRFSWYKKLCAISSVDFLVSSTLTFEIHGEEFGDYYRFSPAAYKDVFFNGYIDVKVQSVMQPPRIIGIGMKPN